MNSHKLPFYDIQYGLFIGNYSKMDLITCLVTPFNISLSKLKSHV